MDDVDRYLEALKQDARTPMPPEVKAYFDAYQEKCQSDSRPANLVDPIGWRRWTIYSALTEKIR
jgi:hypothetical protein